jgi:alkylhydroperoxidase family enzyme
MASATTVGCSWCLDFGFWESTTRGIDPAKLRDVPRWRDSDRFTDLERQVMAYAQAMTTTPLEVTDGMVAGLRRSLDDAQLVELTMMISVENSRSRFNSALGLSSQGFRDRCEIPAR